MPGIYLCLSVSIDEYLTAAQSIWKDCGAASPEHFMETMRRIHGGMDIAPARRGHIFEFLRLR